MLIGNVTGTGVAVEGRAPFSLGANGLFCALELGATPGYCAAMVL
jgi:hypothetical protein